LTPLPPLTPLLPGAAAAAVVVILLLLLLLLLRELGKVVAPAAFSAKYALASARSCASTRSRIRRVVAWCASVRSAKGTCKRNNARAKRTARVKGVQAQETMESDE